ncbi:MAG TPA: dihydrodipicolinate synthase family protein [Acidimicrobiia bacterium]|jgi:4-hydroxy-tetrahydrodipicolinate synthase|nr:dihydrodipicolinate synthase family protein [Acidimicrobiia bacterium]
MAPEYTRAEAKGWARENWRGACNVIIPSYTSDLRSLNEAAIRHDVRRNIELGFWGALLVSEAGTTLDEMRTFMEIAVDEAAGRHRFLLQGVFDTPQDIIDVAKDARAIGVDAMLLGHPNSFYPTTPEEVEDYTVEICRGTDLAVVLFIVEHSNLRRLDVRGFPAEVLDRLTRVDTIVAVKYEVGRQQTVNTYETFKRLQDADVLLSDPMEFTAPMWVDLFDMQWMGTSNYEYYGSYVPRLLDLLQSGKTEDAIEEYWSIQPARDARSNTMSGGGANLVHRYLWKFQAWLNGYNGGPIRQPAMKLSEKQMRISADGVRKAGIAPADEPFADFFVGRNPG